MAENNGLTRLRHMQHLSTMANNLRRHALQVRSAGNTAADEKFAIKLGREAASIEWALDQLGWGDGQKK